MSAEIEVPFARQKAELIDLGCSSVIDLINAALSGSHISSTELV